MKIFKTLILFKFFSIYKHLRFHLCPNVARFFKNSLFGRIRHFKKMILKGRGFQGGSDEKIRRMWLGSEIVVVGLPPLFRTNTSQSYFMFAFYEGR